MEMVDLHALETEWQTDTAPAAQETEDRGQADSQTTVVTLNPGKSHAFTNLNNLFRKRFHNFIVQRVEFHIMSHITTI